MIKNNYWRDSDDIEIEIENPDDNFNHDVEIKKIAPNVPFRNFENIKISAIDPAIKNKIEDLLKKCDDDIKKINRIINHHY